MDTTKSLLNQKQILLLKMKDLLLVNDIYNLQKVKKDYDLLNRKLKRLPIKENFNISTSTSSIQLQQDPYSGYCMTKLNGKVNPRHLKYYKSFKNPVQDHNFLVYEKEVREKFEDELQTTSFQYNPSSLDKKLGMKNNNEIQSNLQIKSNLPINVQQEMKETIKKISVPDETYKNIYGDIFIDDQEILEYTPPNEIIEEENDYNFESEYNNEYVEY